MQIDGISSIPPIGSLSPVQRVDGRPTRLSEFSSEAASRSAEEEMSSMARRGRRKSSERSLGAPATGSAEGAADPAAAIYSVTPDLAAEETAFVATAAAMVDGGMVIAGSAPPGEEYVATAAVLQGKDARGRGIEVPKVLPGPIIDTIV